MGWFVFILTIVYLVYRALSSSLEASVYSLIRSPCALFSET